MNDTELAPPKDAGLFGLNTDLEEAEGVIIPVPWEVTASYGRGASRTPQDLVQASHQLDAFLCQVPQFSPKVCLLPVDPMITEFNNKWLSEVDLWRQQDYPASPIQSLVNQASQQMVAKVEAISETWLNAGKWVSILGGDHSSPLGLLRALAHSEQSSFGILHIDAHLDLRPSYEGFTYSHASIMHQSLKIPAVKAVVHVGVRDFSQQEWQIAKADHRCHLFTDEDISCRLYGGETFATVADHIIDCLPNHVYISFDIDGLSPDLCPGTGTPVPGGLSFQQAVYLLDRLRRSGKQVIGFDLCEIAAPHGEEWDLNVGARVLLHLIATISPS